ncbi:hypothetical protein [Sulfurovum sp.]|uniref:hypothetical protein n=1 Tax=Sulfurovum sp. TaxID=1969726 RepID=UPI002867D01D|nr:hypothetical protein [Sulfurovum sp.]
MKEEIKWITIWILANTVMTILSLTYLYLNHELHIYGITITSMFILLTVCPYCTWKYNQNKFVEKHNIVIQILKE